MRGESTGDYATTGGSTVVYQPDPTDQAALTDQFATVLAGVKSCTFELDSDVVAGVKYDDPNLGSDVTVTIVGQSTPVPFDADNGWTMTSATTVVFHGDACSEWRMPGNTDVHFDFPCRLQILR
jgi:hypothetical protein